MGPNRPLLAYFGHHKCATQWVRSIVSDVCETVGRTQLVFNGVKDFDGDLAAAIPEPENSFLCYMNADRRHARDLRNIRGFHLVRDPRDVVVSAYFSHLYSHPLFGSLAERRAKLQSLPEADGLMMELEGRVHQFTSMLDWDYDQADVLELRMEDVTARADVEIPRILQFLGLGPDDGLSHERVAAIVASRDFTALAGRERGQEDVRSHYRKGVAGDWANHFTPAHIAFFKENYGELLIKLGYEKTDDWG